MQATQKRHSLPSLHRSVWWQSALLASSLAGVRNHESWVDTLISVIIDLPFLQAGVELMRAEASRALSFRHPQTHPSRIVHWPASSTASLSCLASPTWAVFLAASPRSTMPADLFFIRAPFPIIVLPRVHT
jgi:hypothetical protein